MTPLSKKVIIRLQQLVGPGDEPAMAAKKTQKKEEENKTRAYVLEEYEFGARGEQRILDWKDLK